VKHRAYLSGGMEYAAGEGRDWRNLLQAWLAETLGWEVFNPNAESDRMLATICPGRDMRALKSEDPAAYRRIVAQLVDHDCREIALRSDLVICYWDESAMRGAGTKGEVTMARYFGKPVYMVTALPHTEIPGWVLGCTTGFFASFDELKAFLLAFRDAGVSPDPAS
jgi:hypothetical protein